MKKITSLLLLYGLTAWCFPANSLAQGYRWQQSDSTCALLRDEKVVWQLNFSRSQDKPYFHPLRVQGNDLTMERPADHGHHRGLWFAWHKINNVNYWEETHAGVSEGRSKIAGVEAKLNKDFSAKITINLEYGPEGKDVLMKELRVLTISKPDRSGNYSIDWQLNFQALDTPLLLDCVPTLKRNGVQHGGYAGLGYRGAVTMVNPVFTASNGWSNVKNLTGYGENADWMDVSARLGSASGPTGGLTIFDHPKNPRYPSPWYIWYSSGEHLFYMPAILYNEPLALGAGKTMNLAYRVHVHIDELDNKKSNYLFRQFGKM
jgi:hypothetical protein